MKKVYIRLILFALLCFSGISQTNAQIYGSMLQIKFVDQLGNQLSATPEVYIRNTDSVGHPAYPFLNRNIYTGNPGFYIDSCIWDSTFQDTMVSIHYYACGQWNTLDTFFNTFPGWWGSGSFADLNLEIKIPCIQPCNAEFYSYEYLIPFQVWVNSNHKGTGIHHLWLFGDGHSDTNDYVFHTYADTGTYIIQHIVWNSVSNCTDTTWDSVSFQYNCDARFYKGSQGNGAHYFSPLSSAGYLHIWDMGDGNTRYDSSGYFIHNYATADTFFVRHIVYKGTYCSDTAYDTVFNYTVTCNYNFSSVSKSSYTVTVYPTITTMALRYDMGDGNILTRTGSFQHTYNGNGSYQIKMQDPAQQCTIRTYNVNINVQCHTNFTVADDGPFTLRFRNPGTTAGTSVFYFGDGDSAYADSISHTYPNTSSGYYSVTHVIKNGSGHVICASYWYAYFNSCGQSNLNWTPDYVQGQVIFDDTIRGDYDSMIVYLILHDSVNATLTAIDSVVIHSIGQYDSAYFYFKGLCHPAGTKYLVKAALLTGSALYADFLPTYSDSSVMWSGAKPLLLGYWGQINMQRGNNPGGPGFIGGYISQGANKSGVSLDGIQVTVLRSDGTPVGYVLSANAGRYEFNNLAYGNYRVLVEIPGKPSQEYALSLTPAASSFDNMDFEVNTKDITTTMTSVKGIKSEGLKLYPNPADHSLFIEWTGGNAAVELLDVNGKTWLRADLKEGNAAQKIDVSGLSPGFYFIRINDGSTMRHELISIK